MLTPLPSALAALSLNSELTYIGGPLLIIAVALLYWRSQQTPNSATKLSKTPENQRNRDKNKRRQKAKNARKQRKQNR